MILISIVEKSQVNIHDPQQKKIWESALYVNPVDLVCGLRDYRGNKFSLTQFSDPDMVFVSKKSYLGKDICVLELPGLWNGSMAHWNTIFVEVPLCTFNPVKKITDLLAPLHQ